LESVCRATYRGFESHSLRHSVWCRRDDSRTPGNSSRKHRDSAGSWRRGVPKSEPETARSTRERRPIRRTSLLPSPAVQIRFPFAPQGIPRIRFPFAPPASLRPLRHCGRSEAWPPNPRGCAGWGAPRRRRAGDCFHWPRNGSRSSFVSAVRLAGSDSLVIRLRQTRSGAQILSPVLAIFSHDQLPLNAHAVCRREIGIAVRSASGAEHC